MNKEKTVKKNLDLLEEFMRYAFDNPEILDQIPPDASLIILPENNSELYKKNLKVAYERMKAGEKVVVFKIKIPEPNPPLLEKIAM